MGQVRPQALRSAPRVTPRAAEVNDHRRDALPRGRAGDAAPSATDRSDVDQGGRSWGRRTRRRPRRQGAAPAVAECGRARDVLDVDQLSRVVVDGMSAGLIPFRPYKLRVRV